MCSEDAEGRDSADMVSRHSQLRRAWLNRTD